MTDKIFLIAYDICEPGRLRRVHRAIKAWKASGQKSVAECWLSPDQRTILMRQLAAKIDNNEDKLQLMRLDPRSEVMMFGIAHRPQMGAFVIS
jgi:CRISPR-associated protein Cas2